MKNAIILDDILPVAERESGGFGLADDDLKARAAAIIEWISRAGPFTTEQAAAIRRQVLQVMANRLRLALDRQHYPAIAEEMIERPIFIIGFARSGTTLLHSLLAEDPGVLAPQSWHILQPSPPPGAMPVVKGRIAAAQRAVMEWSDFCPAQRSMHPYIDKGAFQLCEDEEVFTLDFRNAYPYHYYRVPTAENPVVVDSDGRGTFQFHRQFLQHLQWNSGKTRWVCKGPSAQYNLGALFDVYPDALCIWPHRPLGEIFASNIALRAAIYDTISGKANDWSAQARTSAISIKAAFDRVVESGLIDDPRIIHLPFSDISADPVGAVRNIYGRAGLSVSAEFTIRMKRWLDDPENRVDRYGRYPYSYEAFGLDKAWVEELFADYSARFGI